MFTIACAHTKKTDSESSLATVIDGPASPTKIEAKKDIKKDNKNEFTYNCSLGKDSRTISMQKGEKRCEVHYTKSGNQNQIAWAQKTPGICDSVFNQVLQTIEKGGFKCINNQTTASN
jgi:hypothetical protein